MAVHGGLIGNSKAMHRVFDIVEKAAHVDLPVLIEGETGTGKELVAREIHAAGERRREPFVAVNTGAISRELVASELFGHIKGAFTGATDNKDGRFTEADRGTLFLDEISTMEERVQVALLRVLETGSFRPVGAKADKSADVRLVAATNVSLDTAIDDGLFRRDLLHRLSVFRISLAPLRERVEDIPMMAESFIAEVSRDYALDLAGISPEALKLLSHYAWPGNVRELKNVMAQACILAERGRIEPEHLPPRILETEVAVEPPPVREPAAAMAVPGNGGGAPVEAAAMAYEGVGASREGVFFPVGASLEDVQKAYTLKTLQHCGNNKTRAAKTLQVSRKTLYDKLLRWGVMTRSS